MYDLINAPLPKLPKSVKLAVKAKEECLMKKSIVLCMIAVVLISVFVGCSVKNSDVNKNAEISSFSASKETTLTVSTAENDTKADTTTTAPTANAKITSTTSNKIELSETTTKRKVVSTTSKPVQTTKSTTQPTTQKLSQCSNNNNHSMKCGNMGRWFDSKSDVKAYVDSVMKSWADKWESGEISDDEYFSNCPQGYECWSCGYCGKWTGNFK